MPKGGSQGGNNVIELDFGTRKKSPVACPEKATAFATLLERGGVKIAIDARRDHVSVPVEFKNDYNLTLEFSSEFRLEEFHCDEFGVTALMLFKSGSHQVFAPWKAVFAMCGPDEEEMCSWVEDFPAELQNLVPDPDSDVKPRKAQILHLVK